jgi:hypothetical protein
MPQPKKLLFSAFYKNPQLLTVLDSMPPALISSLNLNVFNLTTVTGFFGIMIIYFNLILSISGCHVGQRYHFQRRTG